MVNRQVVLRLCGGVVMGRLLIFGILVLSQGPLFITESLAGSVMRTECEGAVRALDSKSGLTFGTGYCAGFLRGTFDAVTSNPGANFTSEYRVCSPKTPVTTEQLIRVYMNYLDRNPQIRQDRTHVVALKAFRSEWPCTKSLVYDSRVSLIQSYLNKLGYQVGTIDGLMGEKTRGAVKEFQRHSGLSVTGEITAELEKALRDAYINTSRQ